MQRYFLYISYKGTNLHGWQKQPNARTVQEEIEGALSKIFRQEVPILGSGRTDKGVHASEQVAHVDLPDSIPIEDVKYKLNAMLSKDIAIHRIVPVKVETHARFDAVSRSYIYKLSTEKTPFQQDVISYYPTFSGNLELLNEIAAKFVGKKDFESFSKVKTEVNNFFCDITSAQWYERNGEFHFEISANRFLRGMVRAIVGTTIDITNGHLSIDELDQILASKDRRKAGKAAKPEGLFLCKVEYPEEVFS